MKNNGKANGWRQLLRGQRGNVAVILAIFMLPLAALVGSGLDVSRAYLAKTRLQQACDAGVLAGRKMMGTSSTVSQPVTDEVRKYVNFNFPQGTMSTSTFSITPSISGTGSLSLSMSTNVNTSLMKLFNKNTIPVSVTCSSTSSYNNIDLVLVLDTTGSMACGTSRTNSSCSSWFSRSAQTDTLTVDGITKEYVREETSSGNNVSRIEALRNSLASLKTTLAPVETEFAAAPAATRKRIRYGIVPFSQMVNAGFSRNAAGQTLYSRQSGWFRFPAAQYVCGWRSCYWTTPVTATTWDGCVEERGTSNTITASSNFVIGSSLPSGTYDLDINLAPTSATPGTQWLAADPGYNSGQYACPGRMYELQEMSTSDFNAKFTQASGFIANGGTYLDMGMLWAARLLSRSGLWSSDNPTEYHNAPVSRYVIFMTDGSMDVGNSGYGAYNAERTYRRVTTDGNEDTANANHSKRLDMICDFLKQDGVKIYSVQFGADSTPSSDLTNCASGSNYVYSASDQTALTNAFNAIARQIGSLRLDQ